MAENRDAYLCTSPSGLLVPLEAIRAPHSTVIKAKHTLQSSNARTPCSVKMVYEATGVREDDGNPSRGDIGCRCMYGGLVKVVGPCRDDCVAQGSITTHFDTRAYDGHESMCASDSIMRSTMFPISVARDGCWSASPGVETYAKHEDNEAWCNSVNSSG